jgi:hypothetical protein
MKTLQLKVGSSSTGRFPFPFRFLSPPFLPLFLVCTAGCELKRFHGPARGGETSLDVYKTKPPSEIGRDQHYRDFDFFSQSAGSRNFVRISLIGRRNRRPPILQLGIR